MEKKTFTRTELYDLVWSDPLLTISKKYNISDVGLRKICIRLNIPLPKNGHWQKVQYGKKVTKTPLPPAVKEEVITFGIRDKNSVEIVKELSPLKELQKEIEEQLGDKLVVSERLTNPDKSIIATKEILSGKIKYADKAYYDVLEESMHIRVSKEQAPRALRIMDTLIKVFRFRGHSVNVSHAASAVKIKGQVLTIGLREKTKRVKRESDSRYDSYDYVNVGILILKVIERYSDKEFADGRLPLEKQLSLIIASFELWANEMNEREERWRLERIKRDEEERIKKDFEKRQDEDLKAFRETLDKANRWHKAENLRNYINEVESRAIVVNNLKEETQAWLIWARKKADWYDPFIEAKDELLDKIDKETLITNRKSYY
jgi:hypothetical protein